MSERLASGLVLPRIGLARTATLLLLGLIVLMAAVGPLIVPYDPIATDPPAALQSPSMVHLFGTDQLGRDVFSRVIVSASP